MVKFPFQIALIVASSVVLAFAQTQGNPSFEVASVKFVDPPAPAHAVGLNITPGRLGIDAATLRQIIGLAYGIQRVRVVGGPGWTDFEEYTIAAKPERSDASRDQIRTMLQTLLADRFKVSLHRETKEITVSTSSWRLTDLRCHIEAFRKRFEPIGNTASKASTPRDSVSEASGCSRLP